MQKYSSGGSVTTTADEDLPSQRRIQRLRLTLHSTGQDEATRDIKEKDEKSVNGTKRRKNGYVEPPAQRAGADSQQEVMACEWSSANAQRHSLESEVRTRTAAMESYEQMNSSLISANIDLQKSLLEKCTERAEARVRLKSLCSSCQQAEERLREKDMELAAAHAENQSLRLQVEASQEANYQALQEMTVKLQKQYEEQLLNEQKKHREEIEALQVQIDEYMRRLEEAENNARIERSQLQQKLQECEAQLRRLEQTDQVDANITKRGMVVLQVPEVGGRGFRTARENKTSK
ncbi:hypothetical protein JZ751_020607 [Albula glossodonta]|uniref:Uncharacterized protein n=1 Tax=Albula glossodonta TaxID=121402 RepID=A0A8T2PI80_9TELE|nr:hypothetical protein JZ751_020607 [Albula glossodonta]